MNTLFESLNSNKAVLASGFAAGFVYAFKLSKRTLNYPLTTLFESALEGTLTLFMISLIIGYFPENFRFVIPCTVAASCIFWKYNDLFHNKKNKPFFKFSYKTTNSVTNITIGDEEKEEKEKEKEDKEK
jgi:hypothetical protein